ncbi:hypothetical protein BV20DRAFT_937903 [Pilatotrama ljubarskyi]|nr:hypothetical protein BV20DRAFT_937903 [Pilatotrama ljubarskyi]
MYSQYALYLWIVDTWTLTDGSCPAESLALIFVPGSAALEATDTSQSDCFHCYMCLAEMEVTKAYNHVGAHILRAIRLLITVLAQVGKTYHCSFCGCSGLQECLQLYLTKSSSPQPWSFCCAAHKFRYADVLTSTILTPCINVPIICLIPGCRSCIQNENGTGAIWKHNVPQHIKLEHPGYSVHGLIDGSSTPLPAELVRYMFICNLEEERLGILKAKISAKAQPCVHQGASASPSE